MFKRFFLVAICSLVVACSLVGCQSKKDPEIILSTTTSVNDSGLMDALKPEFEKDTGYTLSILSQGSGQAIKTAENGDADVLLVHSPKAEEEFVTAGYSDKRQVLMYNYFLIVGPEGDPAKIKGMTDANQAFSAIAQTDAPFVSRGDESGTHTKELSIWKAAGMETPSFTNYMSAGRGMGDTLKMADEKQGYTITDSATYLSMKDSLSLVPQVEQAQDLKNTYSILVVSAKKNAGVNQQGAEAFAKWMFEPKAKDIISKYGIEKYGQSLFFLQD